MKELSIEEKAKRFDEVLAMAKECITYIPDDAVNKYMLNMFPELKESEDKDEKIRKALIDFFNKGAENEAQTNGVCDKDIITWLEKQGKQKEYTFKSIPRLLDIIEPSDKAKAYCQKLIDSLEQEGYSTDAKIVRDCLKQMNDEKVTMATMDEQKPAWGEEDERMFHTIIADLNGFKHGNISTLAPHFDNCIAWLKSLKDRYIWKPSEEQIEAVATARAFVTDDFDDHPTLSEILIELEKQLKKLRKE